MKAVKASGNILERFRWQFAATINPDKINLFHTSH